MSSERGEAQAVMTAAFRAFGACSECAGPHPQLVLGAWRARPHAEGCKAGQRQEREDLLRALEAAGEDLEERLRWPDYDEEELEAMRALGARWEILSQRIEREESVPS